MRIAILTYWSSSDNYGQLLQCYALQKYLHNKGHEAYLVRYQPVNRYIKNRYSIWDKLKGIKLKNLLPWVRKRLKAEAAYEDYLRVLNKELNKRRKFDEFRDSYLNVSKIIYHSIEELRANPPQAYIYICGSDQVWHDSLLLPNVAGWYLQFGDSQVKRISYAASIGREITLEETAIFKKYLSRFNAISLREQNACDYVRSIGFNRAVVVADPTILLPIDEFSEIIPPARPVSKPYIFFYTLNIKTPKEICWDEIYPIIIKEDLDIKSVGSSGYYPARNIIPNCENIQATIPEWFSLIKGAKYVVTTSFHGIVFCVKMHIPFMAVLLRNENSSANNRITSFLNSVGLSNRIHTKSTKASTLLCQEIDWHKVDKALDCLKATSEQFLESSFNDK